MGGLALGVGAAAVGIGAAAVGIGVYSNHVQKAKVDTQLASTELSNFTKTANDLKGTQLDKLLSTGWSPARDEITSATEAFSKFGDTAKSAMDSGFGKNTNNFKNYMNDVKQLDKLCLVWSKLEILMQLKRCIQVFVKLFLMLEGMLSSLNLILEQLQLLSVNKVLRLKLLRILMTGYVKG